MPPDLEWSPDVRARYVQLLDYPVEQLHELAHDLCIWGDLAAWSLDELALAIVEQEHAALARQAPALLL